MYKTVNSIQQFDFQINRVLTYGEKACDEDQVISALANVKNIDEWYEAWLSLANDAINSNEHMHAAYYYLPDLARVSISKLIFFPLSYHM